MVLRVPRAVGRVEETPVNAISSLLGAGLWGLGFHHPRGALPYVIVCLQMFWNCKHGWDGLCFPRPVPPPPTQ